MKIGNSHLNSLVSEAIYIMRDVVAKRETR